MSAHPELVTCPACGPQLQFQGSLRCGSKGNEEGSGRGIGKEARTRSRVPIPPPAPPHSQRAWSVDEHISRQEQL